MTDLFTEPSAEATTIDRDGDLPYSLELDLVVRDRDVIAALAQHAEGRERNEYALEALKIGILALRHVGGQATADLIQRESKRLVEDMNRTMELHKQQVSNNLSSTLKDYFDPKDGRFSERVQRLVANDGELSKLICGFIDGENSLISRTLVAHVGRESPLMKQLDPQQSQGLLAVLKQTVDVQLTQQRDHILREFSLDTQGGALKRLVDELTSKHGDLSKDLQKKIDEVVKEFSLNEENSALSRLVKKVTVAQQTITDEFSLKSETSALSCLKKELVTILEAHVKTNADFQEEVKLALQKLVTKREVEAGTPRHGFDFEDALFEILRQQADHLGDTAEHTGTRTGQMKGRVVGDAVITLGAETAAPGARIVFEAKEKESYSLDKARAEMEIARKNRDAEIGVFVYSRKTAPEKLRPISRHGQDIFVIWDAEDPSTDIHLTAAFDIARCLCIKKSRERASAAADFTTIDKAILDIETRAKNLGEIDNCAKKIAGNAEDIQNRVRIDRKELEKQIGILRECIGDLRDSIAGSQ